MIYRKLLLITTGILSLLFVSCKENPTSVGAGLLKGDYVGVNTIDSYTDSLRQNSSYFKKVIPLGGGATLLVGKDINVTASSLIKFYFSGIADTMLSDLADNKTQILSTTVYLYSNYSLGDSTAPYGFSIHDINSDWSSLGFDGDSLSTLSYSSNDIGSDEIIGDSITSFNIPPSLVLQWIQAYNDSNYIGNEGIYIKPTSNTQRIVGYQALSLYSSTTTLLKVVMYKAGSYNDTLEFYPSEDVAVVQGSLPTVSSSSIVIQGGLTANSKLWFDASKIPSNAVINQAILTLNVDTLQSVFGPNCANSIIAWNLSDSTNNLIDSTTYVSLTKDSDIVSGDIASLVQKWVDSKVNQGLFLEDGVKASEVDLYVLKGSKDSNYALRPRLKILYTLRN